MDLIKMVFSVLDRKPITNEEARKNFKECINDYLFELQKLEPIQLDAFSSVKKQQDYLIKLISLNERYKKQGNDFLTDDKIETFLLKLQDMCRDYLHNDLFFKIREEEQNHYSRLAFTKNSSELEPKTRLSNLKEMAFQNLK